MHLFSSGSNLEIGSDSSPRGRQIECTNNTKSVWNLFHLSSFWSLMSWKILVFLLSVLLPDYALQAQVYTMYSACLLFSFFKKNIYFWERKHEWRRSGLVAGDRGSEAGSEMTAASPVQGLNPWTMRSWPELKSDTELTEPPSHPRPVIFWGHLKGSKYFVT